MIQSANNLAIGYRSYKAIFFIGFDPEVYFIDIASNDFAAIFFDRKFAYWLNVAKFIEN